MAYAGTGRHGATAVTRARALRHLTHLKPATRAAVNAAEPAGLSSAQAAAQAALTAIAGLAAYVPRRVARSAASANPPAPPCCAPMPAVLLFADVSGYSALTAWVRTPALALALSLSCPAMCPQMHTRFEQGAWATCCVLNNLFGSMSSVVDSHGGDILKFAGDALIVAWPLESNSEAEARDAARAATCCAHAMLALEPTRPAAGEPPLSLHIAVHVGTLSEMHLGDGDAPGGRWEHACFGEPLAVLGRLVEEAAPRTCVASHAVWGLLRDDAARGAPCADGAVVAAPPPQPAAPLRALLPVLPETALARLETYLPPAFADSLAAGEHAWRAELRHVSCLFILLPPCGADDFALAQACVSEVHAVARRTGGSPQQSICDDKGTVSICVWGKPPDAHADDPARALAAALELHARLSQAAAAAGRSGDGARVACGLCSGRAFVGTVGASQRCEWAVVGTVMNEAARLMTAAAAQGTPLLCDEATAEHVRRAAADQGERPPSWLLDAPRSVQLKGGAAPARVYAPRSSSEDDGDDAGGPVDVAPSTPPETDCSSLGLLLPDELRRTSSDATSTRSSAELERRGSSDGERSSGDGGPRVGGSTDGSRRTAGVLGRDAELVRAAAVLRTGGIVFVSGDVSSGKSAFVRAAACSAADAACRVMPLAPCGSGGCSGAAFRTPWLAAATVEGVEQLPPPLRHLAPLLADLLPPGAAAAAALATPHSAAALAALTGESARVDALCSVVAALLAPAMRPSFAGAAPLLIADDAHLMDDTSAAVLAAVLNAAPQPPALLLAMPRQEVEDPAGGGARLLALLSRPRAPPPTHVVLGALPAPAAHALVAAELGAERLPNGLLPALMRLAGGQPLLLREHAALLLRAGHVEVSPSGDATLRCDAAALPALVAQALAQGDAGGGGRMAVFMQRRMDALSADARAAVRASAVLGGEFDLPLIARCCSGLAFAAVCAAAAELQHEGLWVPATPPAPQADAFSCPNSLNPAVACYAFAHGALRQLVLVSTPEDARAELHAAVLVCVEARCGPVPDTVDGWRERVRLARGANLPLKAAHFAYQAARAAMAGGDVRGPAAALAAAAEGLTSLREAATAQAEAEAAALSTSPPAAPRLSMSAHAARVPRHSAGGAGDSAESAALRARLHALQEQAHGVQASWAALQPKLQDAALAMTQSFVARCPAALDAVRGKAGLLISDPSMGAVMVAHQATLLRLVGSCVSGQRDPEELASTLLQCGRMHARFGASSREFFNHCGAALLEAVEGALGAAEFNPAVRAAWAAAYAFVEVRMLQGVDQVIAAMRDEPGLKAQLLGGDASGSAPAVAS